MKCMNIAARYSEMFKSKIKELFIQRGCAFENRPVARNVNFLRDSGRVETRARTAVTNIELATHVIGDAENRGMSCIIAQPTASGRERGMYA